MSVTFFTSSVTNDATFLVNASTDFPRLTVAVTKDLWLLLKITGFSTVAFVLLLSGGVIVDEFSVIAPFGPAVDVEASCFDAVSFVIDITLVG